MKYLSVESGMSAYYSRDAEALRRILEGYESALLEALGRQVVPSISHEKPLQEVRAVGESS
jgi:hypothetical protein